MRLKIALWLMLSLIVQRAELEERIDLYRVSLPIADNSSDTREAAFRDGLEALMVRLTGKRYFNIGEHISLRPESILGLVQQYRYQFDNFGDDSKKIEILYDSSAVHALLQKAELSLWNEERPSLLLWLVVQEGGERRLVTDSETSVWVGALKARAALRGLPIILPLGDIEDAQNVDVSELWGGFYQKTVRASERYQADMVLVGKLRADGLAWQSDWSLFSDYPRVDWQLTNDSQSKLLEEVVDSLLEPLAQRFLMPISQTGRGRVLLEVSGVNKLSEVDELMNQLRGLSPVANAVIHKARATKIQINLIVDGNKTNLLRALEKLSQLESASHIQTIDPEVDLHYRWVASKMP